MFNDELRIDPQTLPIIKKGMKIFEVVRQIGKLIPDDDEPLAHVRQVILEDALILTVKVAGARGGSFV